MAIPFTCEKCGHSEKAKDELAGTIVKCSKCGNNFEIPPGTSIHNLLQPPQTDVGSPSDFSNPFPSFMMFGVLTSTPLVRQPGYLKR